MAKIKNINMNEDTFAQMKHDMTEALNKLLRNMQEYGADEAAMTVKLSVSLDDQTLDNGQQGTVPIFKHKVTTTVSIKDESSGELGGDYYLRGDGNGGHSLVPITDQMDMFEEEIE